MLCRSVEHCVLSINLEAGTPIGYLPFFVILMTPFLQLPAGTETELRDTSLFSDCFQGAGSHFYKSYHQRLSSKIKRYTGAFCLNN